MGKHKVLTREEYAEKFNEQMNRYNYIPQAGEHIKQCEAPYPDYWFASDKGYVFTAYYKDVKILNDNPTEQGLKNKSGVRAGKKWRYSNEGKDVPTWKVIADTFCENEFTGYENESEHIHHIQKRQTFEPNEGKLCNRAENLQKLPTPIHRELNHYHSKTMKELDEETQEKIIKSGCPVYGFTEEGLEQFLIQAIRSSLANGVEPIIYTTTITDDVSQIKAEAHPVKSIEFDSVDSAGNKVKVTEKTNFKKTMEKIDSMMK